MFELFAQRALLHRLSEDGMRGHVEVTRDLSG